MCKKDPWQQCLSVRIRTNRQWQNIQCAGRRRRSCRPRTIRDRAKAPDMSPAKYNSPKALLSLFRVSHWFCLLYIITIPNMAFFKADPTPPRGGGPGQPASCFFLAPGPPHRASQKEFHPFYQQSSNGKIESGGKIPQMNHDFTGLILTL